MVDTIKVQKIQESESNVATVGHICAEPTPKGDAHMVEQHNFSSCSSNENVVRYSPSERELHGANAVATQTGKGSSAKAMAAEYAKWQRVCASRFESVGPDAFDCISSLGSGTFGQVHKVKHKSTHKVFAMKIVDKGAYKEPQHMRFAFTELKVMSTIQHPYIVAMHYAFQTKEKLVYVMDYCPNGSLQDMVESKQQLSENVARHYTAEVLMALEHLHKHNIVYRDLKPENTVFDAEGHAKLIDFGLAREGVGGFRELIGSVCYLAPEIIAKAEHGRPVDIYNLGTQLYFMLVGCPPFYDDDRDRMWKNISCAPLSVPAHVSQPCASFIGQVMKRNPSDRLGSENTALLRGHAFTSSIDWDKLYRKEIPVPKYNASNNTRRGRGPFCFARGMKCFKQAGPRT